MADLLLAGMLNFKGALKLTAEAGFVKANGLEVLVEAQRGRAGNAHGQAPAPVPIPPPPARTWSRKGCAHKVIPARLPGRAWCREA